MEWSSSKNSYFGIQSLTRSTLNLWSIRTIITIFARQRDLDFSKFFNDTATQICGYGESRAKKFECGQIVLLYTDRPRCALHNFLFICKITRWWHVITILTAQTDENERTNKFRITCITTQNVQSLVSRNFLLGVKGVNRTSLTNCSSDWSDWYKNWIVWCH